MSPWFLTGASQSLPFNVIFRGLICPWAIGELAAPGSVRRDSSGIAFQDRVFGRCDLRASLSGFWWRVVFERSCDSSRATVHVQVNDVNEYSPVFKEKSYKATVTEGKAYDSILRVEAVDADCSFQFSQICSYEIVTPDVPFTVDKEG